MRSYDVDSYDSDQEIVVHGNRPVASSPRHGSRQQFSYARSRKRRSTTQFNGLHRRRAHRWTW